MNTDRDDVLLREGYIPTRQAAEICRDRQSRISFRVARGDLEARWVGGRQYVSVASLLLVYGASDTIRQELAVLLPVPS